jgi:hypothetical protein
MLEKKRMIWPYTFRIRVHANKLTPTGIYLDKYDRIKITSVQGSWMDSIIECDAAGWDHWIYRPFNMFKPVPEQPFMLLLAQIGSIRYAVGTGQKICTPETGELILFPNDITWLMWNNHGWIDVDVCM